MAYGLFGWNALGGKKRQGRFITAIILCVILGLGVSSFSFARHSCYWVRRMEKDLPNRIGKSSGGVFGAISSGWIMFITMIYDLTFYSSKNFFVLLINFIQNVVLS